MQLAPRGSCDLRSTICLSGSSCAIGSSGLAVTYEDPSSAGADAGPSSSSSSAREYPCLIRATNGKAHGPGRPKKIKLSTLVQPADHASFTLAYGALLKRHMAPAMRKKSKDRKRKDKERAAAMTAAAGRKGAPRQAANLSKGGLPKVVGPKRGPGSKKRKSTWKARVKAANKILAQKRRRIDLAKPIFDLPPPAPPASA